MPAEASHGLAAEDLERLLTAQRTRAQDGDGAPLLATLLALADRDEVDPADFHRLTSEVLRSLCRDTRVGPSHWSSLRRLAQACTTRHDHDHALIAWTLLRRSLRVHRGNHDPSTLAAVIGRTRSLIALGDPRGGRRLLRAVLRIADDRRFEQIARSARTYLVTSLRRGSRAERLEAEALERGERP